MPVWNPGEIGKRIRRLREERGLGQHELGVHRMTIQKLESGERGKKPGHATLLKIARALDVPLHEITGAPVGPVMDLDAAFAEYLRSREAGFGKPPEPDELRYLKAHPHPAWVHSAPTPGAIFHALESLRDLEKWPEILANWVAANPASQHRCRRRAVGSAALTVPLRPTPAMNHRQPARPLPAGDGCERWSSQRSRGLVMAYSLEASETPFVELFREAGVERLVVTERLQAPQSFVLGPAVFVASTGGRESDLLAAAEALSATARAKP